MCVSVLVKIRTWRVLRLTRGLGCHFSLSYHSGFEPLRRLAVSLGLGLGSGFGFGFEFRHGFVRVVQGWG